MEIQTSWNLEQLGKNKENLKEELSNLKQKAISFSQKWKSKNFTENPQILKQALDEYEKLQTEISAGGNLGIYFWLLKEKEQANTDAKANFNLINETNVEIANELNFFELKLSKLEQKKQDEFLNPPELKEYSNYVKRIFRAGKHTLSEKEETLFALKSGTAYENWKDILPRLLSIEEKEIEFNGKTEKKNFEELLNLMKDKNKSTRDAAAKAFNEILKKYEDISEIEINSILENKKTNDKIRNYSRPDESRHISDDVESEIVDALISAVSENFSIPKEFYRLKTKLLGLEKLEYHERNVHYGEIKDTYDSEKASELTKKALQNLDPQFSEIFESFLENGQIDFYPMKGKRPGAFCVWFGKDKPVFVMLNHANTLDNTLTIAHEMGHAINAELSKKQNSLQFEIPTSTTETASTFMEDFVLKEILKTANEETKLAIMMQKLNDDITTIFRQIACYKFEQELHEKFRKKGYLSKEEIGIIFQRHMSSYMGEFVEQSPGSENWWVYWGHIRAYFYNYSYAFGLLISKALQKMVNENPEKIKQVKEFLSAGSSDSPKNIFKKLGIDITKKEFWLSGIKEVQKLLKETESLAKKLKKIE